MNRFVETGEGLEINQPEEKYQTEKKYDVEEDQLSESE
jgi:hypothetical protein